MRQPLGDIEAVVGRITYASATVPALRAGVKYAAEAILAGGEVWFAANNYPLNMIVPVTDTRLKVIPAKVGDPCIVVRPGGVGRVVTFTEYILTGACP